jgi:hypothetical protein
MYVVTRRHLTNVIDALPTTSVTCEAGTATLPENLNLPSVSVGIVLLDLKLYV